MGIIIIIFLLILGIFLATILPIFIFKKYFSIELSDLKIFFISIFLNSLFLVLFTEIIFDFSVSFSLYFAFILLFYNYFAFVFVFTFLIYSYFFSKSLNISLKKFFLFYFSIIFSGFLFGFLYFGFLENFFKPYYEYSSGKIYFGTKIYKNLEVGDKIIISNLDIKFDSHKFFLEINKKENGKIIIFSEKFGEEYEKGKVLEEKEILGKVIFETGI